MMLKIWVIKKQGRAYTLPGISHVWLGRGSSVLGRGDRGWAGAVGCAVYTTISVTCSWTRAVMC